MFNLKNTIIGALTATVAVCSFGSTASAEVFNPGAVGAALVVPWETDAVSQGKITIATVTNTLSDTAIVLHVTVMDEFWNATDFNCPLTPSETTSFEFAYDNFGGFGSTSLKVECSDPGRLTANPQGNTANQVQINIDDASRGIMFVSVECPGNTLGCPVQETRYDNALLGDATIIDLAQGYAYSVSAIHIQAADNQGGNNDRQYLFDDNEYKEFPATLNSNFISPSLDGIAASVILFTLDGTVNDDSAINFKLTGFAYDDDENPISGGEKYDCYTNTPLQELFSTNVFRERSGSSVGHMELIVDGVSNQVDSNEQFGPTGDGDGARVRPVHGWIVQHIADGASVQNPLVPVMNGAGAFARTLTQSTLDLEVENGDIPGLTAN
jgi:hypothetical protein